MILFRDNISGMQLTKFAAVVLVVAVVCLAVTAGCAVAAPADGTSRGMQIPITGITADADTIFFFFAGCFSGISTLIRPCGPYVRTNVGESSDR